MKKEDMNGKRYLSFFFVVSGGSIVGMKFELEKNSHQQPKENTLKRNIVRAQLILPILFLLQVFPFVSSDELGIMNTLFYIAFVPVFLGILAYPITIISPRYVFLPAFVMHGAIVVLLLLAPSVVAERLVVPTWCSDTTILVPPDSYYIKDAEGRVIVNPEPPRPTSVRYCMNESAYWNVVGERLPDPILD